MLNIDERLKQIYKNDRLPLVNNIAPKELTLYFPELDIRIETDRIVEDSFELQESLCSTEDLTLGACEGAIFKITVANLVQDLSGHKFIVTQKVDNTYEMPLGTYVVDSCKRQDNLWFREIVAFDDMRKADKDVTEWYDKLTWPQTVKSMRISLLNYLDIEYEDQTLINDDVVLVNTIYPSSLIGKSILSKLCEINAGFGHITRRNKFKVIQLSGLGLYPSETLYPSEDLFPGESTEFISAGYETTYYEEYVVESITAVTIREDSTDFGTTSGTEDNPYIIEGNYLLYGKSSTELTQIATNILKVIKNKFYRPHKTVMQGLPYLEIGDSINIMTDDGAVETFVFQRTLKGIQALTDDITATGNKKRSQQVGINNQIQQLKGKTLKIVKTIDELSSTMTDIETGLESKITQTSNSLSSQITNNKDALESQIIQTASSLETKIVDNKNALESQIIQTSDSITQQVEDVQRGLQSQIELQSDKIELKVSSNGIIQAINLSSEGAKINVSKLDITGIVTVSDLSTSGKTVINADNITTGKINSIEIQNSEVYIGGNTIEFSTGGAIKRSSSNAWSSTNRSLDNVLSFTSQSIQIGQYSGNLVNVLNIPMKTINLGYSSSMQYTSLNIYAGNGFSLYMSSSNYLYCEYSSSGTTLTPYGNWQLGSSSRYYTGAYISNIYHVSGGKIGFYGKSPISQPSISKLSTGSELSTVVSKINELLDKLGDSSGLGLLDV